jgi:hypothetical protein
MHATTTTPKNLVKDCKLILEWDISERGKRKKKRKKSVAFRAIFSTLDPRLWPYSARNKNKLCACADGSCAAKSPSSWCDNGVNVCVQQAYVCTSILW